MNWHKILPLVISSTTRPWISYSARQMSVFESKWKKRTRRKNAMKYNRRVNPLMPDQGADIPSELNFDL
jgi:hypothetical protein